MLKERSAIFAGSAIMFLSCLVSSAYSQSRTPNPDAPAVLRSWPQSGGWVTLMGRSDNQTLICSMMTGKVESGQPVYIATLTRWPNEWHIGLSDVNKISGTKIGIVIDGVRVGEYLITKRQDGAGPLHTVGVILPSDDSARILRLFRTGATVQFVTDQLTYSFPLTGAGQSLLNMASCNAEVSSLMPTKTGN